ncbi:hypothetical protein ACNFBT_12285 [Pseudomonas sp. NY15181]|uniref:hypothetical protein n=1 Tax=Pseudomonas sp. NY15181 TaxID=3400349 RepID=UPI003A855B59
MTRNFAPGSQTLHNVEGGNLDRLQLSWDAPSFAELGLVLAGACAPVEFRLLHLTEIGEGQPAAYRRAMANVISCLSSTDCSSLYIVSGRPEGVELYVGVAGAKGSRATQAMDLLGTTFKGNFPGAELLELRHGSPTLEAFSERLGQSRHLGLITGVPSLNEADRGQTDEDFQGIERLANSLVGETWQLIVVAEPAKETEIHQTLEQIYELSTVLSANIRQSVQHSANSNWQLTKTTGTSETRTKGESVADSRGKSEGWNNSSSQGSKTRNAGTTESRTTTDNDSLAVGSNLSSAEGSSHGASIAMTRERTDKRAEELQKHLNETLIERFHLGRSKGMYRTAVYASALTSSTYERLSRGVLSIFQGETSSVTPLRAHKLQFTSPLALDPLLQIQSMPNAGSNVENLLAHSVPFATLDNLYGATWLNTQELALIAGLPHKELPGVKIRKSVEFALNTGASGGAPGELLQLGHIIQHGRLLEHKRVDLPRRELSKHVFVTGVTGAGKTTTCMNLLLESKRPFLVIEPAKTEYRALHGSGIEVDYYTLGREDLTPFRLNPFELVSRHQSLASHISVLKATLAAVFPMEAAMPSIVEEAIINAYKQQGWDIHSGANFLIDDPWAEGALAWPTFSDMISELDNVIASKGMGREFEEKYRGSLVARLSSLTLGTKGRMLNTRHSLDFDKLLDRCVVIEMEELKDEQDKALFMGLILTRLAECMKHRHRRNSEFQHLTLVEEAHRLLSRPEPGDAESKKMGVEMFANLLAEVRKYGEGLIIADQIPNKLVADVIKNTNTKIVHRLFAADDRNSIGDAIGLNDDQKSFLPLLQPGETVIYCGGWHAPVRVQIAQNARTDGAEIREEEIRKRGARQLWEQRSKLLPSLSGLAVLQQEQLAGFLHDGVQMLNMFLKINYLSRRAQQHLMRERIQQKLSAHLNVWKQHLALAPLSVESLLLALFRDCASMLAWQERDWSIAREQLPQLFEQLSISLDAYDTHLGATRSAQTLMTTIEIFDSF